MISVKAKNPGNFINAISQWEAQAEKEIEDVVKGYAAVAFKFLLEHSAQGTGDFTANWNLSINEKNYSFVKDAVDNGGVREVVSWMTQDRIMGHPLAINYALDKARPELSNFQLGDTIYFTNSSEHDQFYAWKIENGTINFRDGNEGAPVERTKMYMREYEYINKNRAQILKAEKL